MGVREQRRPSKRRVRLDNNAITTSDSCDRSLNEKFELFSMKVEPGLSEEILSENSCDSWGLKKWHIAIRGMSGKLAEMRGYIKSAGVYALSSIVIPLVSLVLAPFLTHALSTAEYGILTLLNVVISLGAGISQLGLSSAFFRAYNYDYSERKDRQSVVITTTTILLIVSLLLLLGMILTAPLLAQGLLGHSSFGSLIMLAGGVIFVQNMTIPVFSWLRAENRAFYYSILSISNVCITLAANLVLVGVWHWRIAGALVATAGGYFSIVFIALPFILFHTGFRVNIAIARNLLGFGIPLIFGFVSYWILQISDRYLLSYFTSPAETAKYAVAYTLGTANSVVVIAPFLLIWPMTMYSVAKKEDAQDIYRQIFRWLGLLLLSVSFCLSFVAVLLLNWLFPPAYHSAAPVIPVVSASSIFYALYYIFSVGINIKRKMWLTGIYLSIAALVNFLLNLALIPLYGAIGAAFSTLIAYIVLAMAAYIVNQRVYPITFELGRFVVALLIGAGAYSGCVLIARQQGFFGSIAVYSGTFLLYTFCLCLIGLLPAWKWKPRPMMLKGRQVKMKQLVSANNETGKSEMTLPVSICMHVQGTVRTDERVLREATALLDAGFSVTIVDVEYEKSRPYTETIKGITVKHLRKPQWLKRAYGLHRLAHLFEKFVSTTLNVSRVSADVYHAHDLNALPACYIASLIRWKPLVFDAHELPLNEIDALPFWLRRLAALFLALLLKRCSAVMTVSAPIAQLIQRQYHLKHVWLVRNTLAYRECPQRDCLRQQLKLGPEVRIALYQGNLQADRGLAKLVLAAKFLDPNTVIVIMGKAIGTTQIELEQLIVAEKVADRIKILPPVPYSELLNWTSSATIGLIVYPPNFSLNVQMCLPNKLFEYLMAGLPVLATPLDAVSDLLETYHVGCTVASIEPEEVAAAINSLVRDDSDLQRMRSNALAASKDHLCWEHESQTLIQLYQKIVSGVSM